MTSPAPDRKELEDLWRQRLLDAKISVEFAQNYIHEILSDYATGAITQDVERFAHTKAVRQENFALRKYNHVLCIYTDLMVNGLIPNEDEWRQLRTDRGDGDAS
jgi:hypothetical protein